MFRATKVIKTVASKQQKYQNQSKTVYNRSTNQKKTETTTTEKTETSAKKTHTQIS